MGELTFVPRHPSIVHSTGIAPNDLADADDDQDRAAEGPVWITHHEAATQYAPRKIEPLKYPDAPTDDHENANQGTDNPHDNVERFAHHDLPVYLSECFSAVTSGRLARVPVFHFARKAGLESWAWGMRRFTGPLIGIKLR